MAMGCGINHGPGRKATSNLVVAAVLLKEVLMAKGHWHTNGLGNHIRGGSVF